MWTFQVVLVVLGVSAVLSRNVPAERRQIRPHCDVICNEETGTGLTSICGIDGVLYKSKCDYNIALCKARMNGTLLLYSSIGPECVTASTSCDVLAKTQCAKLPHFPTTISGGISIGASVNTLGHSYVCGSDGKNYGSVCELMQTRCKLQSTTLELDHTGLCDVKLGNNSRLVDCSKYVIDLHGLALEQGAHASLRMHPCEHSYDYVCGMDGRTYLNECSLCSRLVYTHQIQSGHLSVHINHDGRCTSSIFG